MAVLLGRHGTKKQRAMTIDQAFWKDRRVFLTGHTGFKGGWLSMWLTKLGAKVFGYALEPPTNPCLFNEARIAARFEASTFADIRDLPRLTESLRAAKPSVVIHLAAQPLVKKSYIDPVETFSSNVMGTVHLLEAVRNADSVEGVLVVTTDKCYENREWLWPYREDDRLGGHDPYSSSKACAELVALSYRRSFMAACCTPVATARAGNVIGGGDWAQYRIVPDFLRSSDRGEPLHVRSPDAIRPWQHVLEPLSGYLMLAEKLVKDGVNHAKAWNFGPNETDTKSVSTVVEMLRNRVPYSKWLIDPQGHSHEAGLLKLDSTNARVLLNWSPRWSLETAIDKTVEWHKAWRNGVDMTPFSLDQIMAYEST